MGESQYVVLDPHLSLGRSVSRRHFLHRTPTRRIVLSEIPVMNGHCNHGAGRFHNPKARPKDYRIAWCHVSGHFGEGDSGAGVCLLEADPE